MQRQSKSDRLVEGLESRRFLSAGLTLSASSAAGGAVARPDGNTGTGFFVSGNKVYDANGYEFRIRGFNHTTRTGDTTKNLDAISEFDKTGANAVRTTFGTFGAGTTPTQRKNIVERYLAEGLVPIVEDHTATNGTSASQIQTITDRWLQPDNVAWLKQYERNVILNIANEWGPDSTVWRDAYISSIARLRDAGVNAMIMVDAAGSGQDMHALNTWAQAIEDADPQHNVVFSIHMYDFWRSDGQTGVGTNSPWQGAPYSIRTELTNFQASGLPLVVGEYSMTGGTDVPYDTRGAMQILDQLGIGSLAWSWNQNGSANHDMLARTAGWQYDSDADLGPLGQLVVNDPLLGTKASARPATSLRPATIRGTVADDTGLLPGVTVYIDDNGNNQLDAAERRTLTDGDGAFALTNLPQGLHRLRTTLAGGPQAAVALPAGDDVTVALTVSANASPTAALNGLAWDDADRDGYRDAGESLLVGRTVYLDLDNDGVAEAGEPMAVSDGNGAFTFTDLAAGTYTARLVLDTGDVATTLALPVTLAAGESAANVSLGVAHPPAVGSITGTLFDDANLNGVRDAGEAAQTFRDVYADLNGNGQFDNGEPTTLTAADGTYLLTRLQPGDYTVRKTNSGWTITTPPTVVTVTAFQTVTAPPIGASETLSSVGGIVFNDTDGDGTMEPGETPAAGITVFIDADSDGKVTSGERTAVTDVNGAFAFAGLRSGTLSYRALAPAGQSLTTGGVTYTVLSGVTYSGVKLGIGIPPGGPPPVVVTGSISGVYFQDTNTNRRLETGEQRVPGAVVFLDTNDNGVFDTGEPTQTTAADGSYAFTNLPAGLYRPRSVAPAGSALTTPQIDVYLSAGQAFSIGRFGTTPSNVTPTTTMTLQAETAALSGGTTVATSWAGYSGTGYADYAGNGSAVQWTFTRAAAGSANLAFRFANGSTTNRPLTILVNGVSVGTVAFPATGNWTTWLTTSPLLVTLKAGTNTLSAIAGSATGANVDLLTLTDAATPPPPPPPPPPTDGNNASLTGTSFNDNNANGNNDTGDGLGKNAVVFLDLDGDNVVDAIEV
ncbi:MAG: Cna B-type [Phycisphaerales bacterium]|nr:Cna B-type [Phycisphaerales bacterium]